MLDSLQDKRQRSGTRARPKTRKHNCQPKAPAGVRAKFQHGCLGRIIAHVVSKPFVTILAPCVTVMPFRCRHKTTRDRMDAVSTIWCGSISMQHGSKRTALLKQSCLPVILNWANNWSAVLLTRSSLGEIDQVLLGYLNSGAAFS
jgi:hypothetical protein